MAVSLYFGLPGAGKTTMMCYQALKCKKSKRYRHIYCNAHIAVEGVTYIDNDCIGKYNLSECAILIDEATLFADNRDYKNFDKGKITYFLEHRHFEADIFLYTQQWDGVDRKIRVITDRVYYVYKGKLLGRWFTRCYRIPYDIIIPDPKKDSSEKLGEIVQGYCKPPWIVRTFSPWLYRPKYYKYFDSWERPYMPPLPSRYKAYSVAGTAQGNAEHEPPKARLRTLLERLHRTLLRTKSQILLKTMRSRSAAAGCKSAGQPATDPQPQAANLSQRKGVTTTTPLSPLSIVQKNNESEVKNDGCER